MNNLKDKNNIYSEVNVEKAKQIMQHDILVNFYKTFTNTEMQQKIEQKYTELFSAKSFQAIINYKSNNCGTINFVPQGADTNQVYLEEMKKLGNELGINVLVNKLDMPKEKYKENDFLVTYKPYEDFINEIDKPVEIGSEVINGQQVLKRVSSTYPTVKASMLIIDGNVGAEENKDLNGLNRIVNLVQVQRAYGKHVSIHLSTDTSNVELNGALLARFLITKVSDAPQKNQENEFNNEKNPVDNLLKIRENSTSKNNSSENKNGLN